MAFLPKLGFLVVLLLAFGIAGQGPENSNAPEKVDNDFPYPQADLSSIWEWFNSAGEGKSIAVAGDRYDRNLTITITDGEVTLTYAFECKGNCTAARERVDQVFTIAPSRRGSIGEAKDPV